MTPRAEYNASYRRTEAYRRSLSKYRDSEKGKTNYLKKLREEKNKRSSPELYPAYMLRNAKARAKKLGVPFSMTVADIIIPDLCPVLGIPLRYGCSWGSPCSPSIDRVVPSKGYVSGNVMVISKRANELKRDCTDPRELRAVADYIERMAPGV